MASTLSLLLLFAWFSSELYSIGVFGRILSKYDDVELEKELALLNKHVVKTIWTTYGEKYDCVYLNKNDRHASPMNHTFHPKINLPFYNKNKNNSRAGTSKAQEVSFDNFWVNKIGCPIGTIPWQRTSKDDLIRAKQAAEIYANENDLLTQTEQGTHYAVVRTEHSADHYIYGGGMKASIHNPAVGRTQYSSTQIRIQNGQDRIEIGWTVNPFLYPDNHTRMFVYSKAGTSSCFNAFCGLYVPESRKIPINAILTPSTRGGPIFDIFIFVERDLPGGDWVLYVGKYKTRIGHWPKNAFFEMEEHATFVEWGGKVYSNPKIPSPPMGNGLDGFKYNAEIDSYCGLLSLVDARGNIVNAAGLLTYEDVKAYGVDDLGKQKRAADGHIMLYGGSGGITGW